MTRTNKRKNLLLIKSKISKKKRSVIETTTVADDDDDDCYKLIFAKNFFSGLPGLTYVFLLDAFKNKRAFILVRARKNHS